MSPILARNRDRYPADWRENRYPADWREIRERILYRAAWTCECLGECGHWHPEALPGGYPGCREMHLEPADTFRGRVMLTIAHLDHDPGNNADENLKAMCQRCHNAYDADHRRQTREESKRLALEAAGQLGLIE